MADNADKIVSLPVIRASCHECTLHELCVPRGVPVEDLDQIESIVRRRRLLKKGEALYRNGEPLRSLYAVRSGSLKATGLMPDGRTQVTGFYLPGDLLGLDAISTDKHQCTTEALETSNVCELPLDALEDLAKSLPGLQRQMFRIMSREVTRGENLVLMLGRMSADERLASFFVSYAERLHHLGLDDRSYRLTMSRQDLADYLGLAFETVSRLLRRFQELGALAIDGRQVRVLDPVQLNAIARPGEPAGACAMRGTTE